MNTTPLRFVLFTLFLFSARFVNSQTNDTNVPSTLVEITNPSPTNVVHSKAKTIYLKVDPKLPSIIPIPQQRHDGFLDKTETFIKDVFGIGQVTHLFNGKDLTDFYPWLVDSGVYVDAGQVFRVEDGLLQITGQHQGYIATKQEFSDYKLVVEYKWGRQTWYKRKETKRNSGIFVNATGLDNVDIRSAEVQLLQGEKSGCVVMHGGASLTVGKETKKKPWSEFNNNEAQKWEKLNDWNKLEIFSEGNRLRILLNGHVTVDGYNLTPTHGKILLQSNGAEVFFRRVDLYDLNSTNAVPVFTGPINSQTNHP